MQNNGARKNALPDVPRMLVNMVQFIMVAIIQFVLFPLTIFGYILSVVKVMLYSKKYGLSATSTNPLYQRWSLHTFGVRNDEEEKK